MEKSVTLREIAASLGVHGSQDGFTEMIEGMTALAIQLDYPASAGTGGAYADMLVSADHAEILVDMVTHTDPETGVYTGDRDAITRAATSPQSA